MATLNVRGLHKFSTNPSVTSDELSFDDTFLFPKWWNKNAGRVEYIRCIKAHVTRDCDDIDLIIPASYDLVIRGTFDGNVTFRIDYHRGIKRMALTAHNSTVVTAEYLFGNRPGQQPRYKKYGAGPVVCFSAAPTGLWATFVYEHTPDLNLGDLSPADGFYDLNLDSDLYDMN